MEFINKKMFAKTELDENVKAFILHVGSFTSNMTIYPAQKAEIALFIAKKVIVPAKYIDFDDVFLKKSAEVLPKRIGINKHAIKLIDSK